MRIIIILLLIILPYITIHSQNRKKLDSLRLQFENAHTDSEKYTAIARIVRAYLSVSMDSAKFYNDKMIHFANNTNDLGLSSKGFNQASTYYYYSAQLDTCLYYVKKAESLSKKVNDHRLTSDLFRKLAILSRENGNFNDYEKYSLLSYEIAKKIDDFGLITSALIVLGNSYYNKNDYENALRYYLKTDSVHIKADSISTNLTLAYENISIIYSTLKNKEALTYIDKTENIYRKLDNKAGIASTDILRASYYEDLDKPEKVIFHLEKVLPFYIDFNEPRKLTEVYTKLIRAYTQVKSYDKAKLILEKAQKIISFDDFSPEEKNKFYYAEGFYYLKTKNYDEAIISYKKALEAAPSNGTTYNLGQHKEISEGLATTYSKRGDYKQAITHYENLILLKDSLSSINKEKITRDLETKYQTEKKEQEIALLEAQNETVKAQKKNQRNLLLGGLGLTSIIGIFLFLGFRNRKKTNDKLRKLDTIKSSFFENISHEFRTPLSLISGPIEEQLQKPNVDTSEKKNLHIAKRNTQRLLTLVDQLLDLSKLEAGYFKLNVQQGDLGLFLRSLTSSFSYLAQENNQEYTTTIDIPENTYYFDSDALEKIITNLISNALKYSPDGESIKITGTIQNQQLQCTVQNSGTILSEEALQTIFNRFERTDEQTAGTGIGLALSKELVTLHKGVIQAQSEHNTTSFILTIPVTASAFSDDEKGTEVIEIPAYAKAETTSSKENLNPQEADIFSKDDKPILLIVDDNADLRAYVSSLFEDQYTIHTAQDGSEGFEIASSIVPDLIITDLMMPKDDGIMLAQNCKTAEATSHIPIIMLTAKAGDENKLIGLETGADAYITKPFNTEILKTTTYNLLETRKRLQERFSQEVVLIPKDIAINTVDERFLDHLKEIVDTQLIESDFTTESFAKALDMSRMQLHRKLKALTGLSATEFIRSQRLKLAAQMLKKSSINVSQVGYAVGFNNHSYFTKCFKEHYGISPSDYSKKS